MRVVLDASAVVNMVLPTQLRDATRRHVVGAELYAPTLLDTEVLSALGRLERSGSISGGEATDAVRGLGRLPCTRVAAEALLEQVWSMRHGVRISDAHYLALARTLDATLLTADGRLARAPVSQGISVLLVR